MHAPSRRASLVALVALVASLFALPALVAGAQTTLVAALKPNAETPPGDPNGSGAATVTIDPVSGQVCFQINVTGIQPATASHIHEAPAGSNGPVVVPLNTTGFTGNASGCVTGDKTKLAAIVANPSGFYVNVHTAAFPGGAVRGQLAVAPNTAMSPPAGPSPATLLGLMALGISALLGAVGIRRLSSRR